ncbi:MAG TPA: Ig-like domain-containing protein, partial [Chthoniobacteraceae bacterium]|nr:Ig-like domain-containing protein [Chthoniobacteraceae bacterium]
DNEVVVGSVRLIRPVNYQAFGQGQPIPISAVTVDQFSSIRRVEFFANETNRIGVSESSINVPVGIPLTNHFIWSNAPAGEHTLTAVARDSSSTRIVSEPVHITVTNTVVPTVGVVVVPRTEPAAGGEVANGSFQFYRTGRTNDTLVIRFGKGGTATPVSDYVDLPNSVVLYAGISRTNVRVAVIDDDLPETNETVVVSLTEPPTSNGPAYQINETHRTARVEIIDNDRMDQAARIEITKPESGRIFGQGEPIPIEAVAVDPRGYIPRVSFYASTNFIGVSEVAFLVEPPPGTPVHHSIVWSNAPIGSHVITASGVNNRGEVVYSGGLPVTVVSDTNRVALALDVIDGAAQEYLPLTPGPDTNAVFRIRRVSGPTNALVSVSITLSGSADPFSDYKYRLSSDAMQLQLPAGKASTLFVISTLTDDIVEGDETVYLTINPPNCESENGNIIPSPSCY